MYTYIRILCTHIIHGDFLTSSERDSSRASSQIEHYIPIPTYMDVRPREPSRWFSSSSSSLYSVVSVVQRALYNILLYCCCEPVCTVHACHLYYIIIDCINILLYIIILLHTHTCALLLLVLVLLLLIRARVMTLPGHTEATQQLFSADRIPKISAVIYGPPRSGL